MLVENIVAVTAYSLVHNDENRLSMATRRLCHIRLDRPRFRMTVGCRPEQTCNQHVDLTAVVAVRSDPSEREEQFLDIRETGPRKLGGSKHFLTSKVCRRSPSACLTISILWCPGPWQRFLVVRIVWNTHDLTILAIVSV